MLWSQSVCRVSFYNFTFWNPFVQIKDLARYVQDASRISCRIPFKVYVFCEGLDFYSDVEKYSSILGYGPMRIWKNKSSPNFDAASSSKKWVFNSYYDFTSQKTGILCLLLFSYFNR
jgi:hypothetical protein